MAIETLARVDVSLRGQDRNSITENETVDAFRSWMKAAMRTGLSRMIGDLVGQQNKDNITMAAMQNFFTEKSGEWRNDLSFFLLNINTAE